MRAVVADEDGVRAELAPPPSATERAADRLPVLDVSKLPGARIVGQRGFEAPGVELLAGCARGPSDRFAPGIEGVLFERATALALRASAIAPDELFPVRTTGEPPVFEQLLAGKRGPDALVVRHALGFVGAEHDVLLCTSLCVGPKPLCDGAALELVGALEPPPPPSLLVRALFAAAEHPERALAIAAGLGAVVVALLLRFRPRPRP